MKKILRLLIILLGLAFVISIGYGIYREIILNEGEQNLSTEDIQAIVQNNSQEEVALEESEEIEELPEEYEGYTVSAKLEIEKINLETYVFEEYDEDAMWICPTKYYGPNPNEIGNYCIAAHNYNKENMFNNIIKLEEGDYIKLTDNINGENNYIVYEVYKTDPNDTEPLSQETNNEVELTLITCSDYSSKRIIVKARKV